MIGIAAGIVLAYYTACPVWAAGLVGLAVYSIPTLMLYFFIAVRFAAYRSDFTDYFPLKRVRIAEKIYERNVNL